MAVGDDGSAQHSRRVRPGSVRPWWALGIDETLTLLDADAKNGLSPARVRDSRLSYGENGLPRQPPPSAWMRFLAQFRDVSVLTLLVAAAVAALVGWFEGSDGGWLSRFGDAAAICIIVLLNALIGFVQEGKAHEALRALQDMTAPTACVRREGKEQRIDASEVVVGDVLVLREGDRIAADVRLLESHTLLTNEASLTGESTPVEKSASAQLPEATPLAERSTQAFMSTFVQRGSGLGVVVNVGLETQIGNIAGLLASLPSHRTPLAEQLDQFGRRVVLGCVVLALLVFALGMFRLDESLGFVLLIAVSLAVAAIPEGLVAITTIVLALGVRRMAKSNALLTRLSAVETLGAAHVICTDKTGTLTQNRMKVRRHFSFADATTPSATPKALEPGGLGGATPSRELPPWSDLVFAAQFAPAAHAALGTGELTGDPTDVAMLEFHADRRGTPPEAPPKPLAIHAFDGERKVASVLVQIDGGDWLFTHGAPEPLLARCTHVARTGGCAALDAQRRARIDAVIEAWAADGLRVIALARRSVTPPHGGRDDLERELCFLGLLGLSDPPRLEVKDAIARARDAGVQTLMITGDHPSTALAIGRELGILEHAGEVISGDEVAALDASVLDARLADVRCVARATAANKLRIVEGLQRRGLVVAMTGDGVNDAPAVRAADIGVAMGRSGTDVTREAADLVLADDNYATIVEAIAEGRSIYSNIQRFIAFLFAANAGLVLTVVVGTLLGWPAILTPTQILWINLITNGLPALALGVEPQAADPMKEAPRPAKSPLVARRELVEIVAFGAWMGLMGLLAFWLPLELPGVLGAELEERRSLAFSVLALAPLFHAFNARSSGPLRRIALFGNRPLLLAMLAGFALQLLAVYTPGLQRVFGTSALSLEMMALAALVASSVLVVGQLSRELRWWLVHRRSLHPRG